MPKLKNYSSKIKQSLDSYLTLLRYTISSMATFIIDFIAYIIIIQFTHKIILANLVARSSAIIAQFTLLNKFVFSNSHFTYLKFLKYCIYVYIMGYVSGFLQQLCISYDGLSIIASKVIIESILYFWNFSFLKVTIFKRKYYK